MHLIACDFETSTVTAQARIGILRLRKKIYPTKFTISKAIALGTMTTTQVYTDKKYKTNMKLNNTPCVHVYV
jgi:hypothetical protein